MIKLSDIPVEKKEQFARRFVDAIMERVEENLYRKTLKRLSWNATLYPGDKLQLGYTVAVSAESLERFVNGRDQYVEFVTVDDEE